MRSSMNSDPNTYKVLCHAVTMQPANASHHPHIDLQILLIITIAGFVYSPDRLISSKIREVFRRYNFKNKSGLLQFWACTAPPESEDIGLNLMLMRQPFVSTEDHEELTNYRNKYLDDDYHFVGIQTKVGKWLAGRTAQTRIADQRTKILVLSPDYQHSAEAEGMGQLAMPVFSGQVGEEKLEGIIELVTTEPNDSYAEDFEQIKNSLEDQGLRSRFMGKTIKVEYDGVLIRFPLPYSAKLTDLQKEVTKRFKKLEDKNFLIEYNDTNGNRLPISCNEDLHDCMAESSSQGAPFIRLYILIGISVLRCT